MSVTDDMVMPTSDSFWELGKFMRTVKRCDNGYKLCDSLRQLVDQRSEIEKKYAKELIQWAKKWNNFLDNGPEYGTTQGAWRGMMCEADSLADIHQTMAEKLMTDVYQSIKYWQKENYHKSMMHFKETKEYEDSFRKVQKPWGKKLTKVMNARKDYHNVCRQEKSTANQENNARADTAVSPDQLKKLQEKLRKLQDEVNTTRDKYQAALADLNSYNAKYMEDMTEVYEKCQNFERQRIEFFKKTLFHIHSCLDLSVEPRYAKIYTDLHSTVANTDPDKDLKWWSANNGVDMAMNWPSFEEYSPEMHSISKRGKSQINSGDGITITRIRHTRESSYETYGQENNPPPSYSNTMPASSNSGQPSSTQNPQHTNTTQASTAKHASSLSATSDEFNGGAANPFGETQSDEEQMEEDAGTDRGVAVKAIYDYDKTEDDEFSFKTGDVFVKLSEEDEMGWCRGRKDGEIGLFPANYVVPL